MAPQDFAAVQQTPSTPKKFPAQSFLCNAARNPTWTRSTGLASKGSRAEGRGDLRIVKL
jgi:hypothetical protein